MTYFYGRLKIANAIQVKGKKVLAVEVSHTRSMGVADPGPAMRIGMRMSLVPRSMRESLL